MGGVTRRKKNGAPAGVRPLRAAGRAMRTDESLRGRERRDRDAERKKRGRRLHRRRLEGHRGRSSTSDSRRNRAHRRGDEGLGSSNKEQEGEAAHFDDGDRDLRRARDDRALVSSDTQQTSENRRAAEKLSDAAWAPRGGNGWPAQYEAATRPARPLCIPPARGGSREGRRLCRCASAYEVTH